jgi:16S rRNA (cytidine1402-2'-O)-methyltransferase
MSQGKLILLPNLLDENAPPEHFLVPDIAIAVRSLNGLITEGEKPARKYLRRFLTHDQMAALPLRLLNEHTKPEEIKELLAPIQRGECWGVLSDAGLPCIADPGAELVALARKASIAIETYPGPSSLLYALQLSGLPAQRFAFHGYLPRESPALENAIAALEKRSQVEQASQLFIEAPYRSAKLLATLLATLKPTTRLCVAASLTSPQEKVLQQTVAEWKQRGLELGKEPTVFVVYCP